MSEDELRKALAENGNFDAEKADRDAAGASSHFEAQLKRAARVTWVCIIVAIGLFEFALVGLIFAFSTKAIVGFATLLLSTIVLLGVFGSRYRIANTRLSLLREIKLLRLELLRSPSERAIGPAREITPSGQSCWGALSRWENMAWLLTLILVALASNLASVRLTSWGATLTSESQVVLSPDGAGTEVFKVSYPHYQWSPMTSSSMWTGDVPYTITQWLDSRGRELPMNVSTIDGNREYTVQLAEPVMPGDRVSETLTAQSPSMATKQGDVWTYSGDPVFGQERNFFLKTVQLPKGAEIVSVDPKPAQQFVEDGRPTVRFQAIRGRNEKFVHSVQYRLPAKTDRETAK